MSNAKQKTAQQPKKKANVRTGRGRTLNPDEVRKDVPSYNHFDEVSPKVTKKTKVKIWRDALVIEIES